MSDNLNNLPIIRLQPGPTDAQLEAERDAKHAADEAAFLDEERRLSEPDDAWMDNIFDHIPPWKVHG